MASLLKDRHCRRERVRVMEGSRFRTMRDIPTTRDVFRERRARSMHDLLGIEDSVSVVLNQAEMAICFDKERKRALAQEQALHRMRTRLRKIRYKLKYAKERNKAISELRSQLEKRRYQSGSDDEAEKQRPAAGRVVIKY